MNIKIWTNSKSQVIGMVVSTCIIWVGSILLILLPVLRETLENSVINFLIIYLIGIPFYITNLVLYFEFYKETIVLKFLFKTVHLTIDDIVEIKIKKSNRVELLKISFSKRIFLRKRFSIVIDPNIEIIVDLLNHLKSKAEESVIFDEISSDKITYNTETGFFEQ